MKNNTNKILTILFSVIFITVFSYYNYPEYKKFHQDKIELVKKQLELKTKLENFKLEDIKKLNDIEFYYTPNKDLLIEITNKIENAEKEIFLETYMLTETRVQEALIKAHKK
jgi:hypothetical protein